MTLPPLLLVILGEHPSFQQSHQETENMTELRCSQTLSGLMLQCAIWPPLFAPLPQPDDCSLKATIPESQCVFSPTPHCQLYEPASGILHQYLSFEVTQVGKLKSFYHCPYSRRSIQPISKALTTAAPKSLTNPATLHYLLLLSSPRLSLPLDGLQ